MASKRSANDSPTGNPPGSSGSSSTVQPPLKKRHTAMEPVRIGPVSTQEDMDIKILQFQNKKLGERLQQRQAAEVELRQRIDQLEKRQTQDDAVLCIVNRYWNQLNEDMRILLERFDAETSDESESKNENEATTSFLAQLSTWDKQELEEKLAQRVQVSQRAVGKIIQAFDRLVQRNEKISLAIKGEGTTEGETPPSLDEVVRQTNVEVQSENQRLHTLVTQLHQNEHTISLKFAELQDKYNGMETMNDELRNKVEDMEYDLSATRVREDKLDRNLSIAVDKIKHLETLLAAAGDNSATELKEEVETAAPVSAANQRKFEEMQRELEEQRELSNCRIAELEKLHTVHKETLKEVEKLKMDIKQLPECVIVETTEYKCLQSQFSVLYNESMQLKTQLEETRAMLQSSKNTHLRQIEHMESEELLSQKKLRTEVIQLEDTLAQVRKEYEMLRIEFEQNLTANEQTGPINREMRQLITSLQNHNQQLKGEVARYKRKLKDCYTELMKMKSDHSSDKSGAHPPPNSSSGSNSSTTSDNTAATAIVTVKEEDDGNTTSGEQSKPPVPAHHHHHHHKGEVSKHHHHQLGGAVKIEGDNKGKEIKEVLKEEGEIKEEDKNKNPTEIIKELRNQIKKAQEAQKEMKLLLDMYKGVAKEQRDKVELMASEKKLRQELDETKALLRKTQMAQEAGERKEGRKKVMDEDAQRKIKQLEETIHHLQKNVAAQKQEEEALLNEMEVTGQAFEDMQEQNIRLIQQLREKDDANFKLMSERIKSNQIHKLLREEKDVLGEQVITLQSQIEAQNVVVRKLEEKERLLQNNLTTVEKELALRQQGMELHKRKAIESAQSAADLKLHLEKYHAQLKEAQVAVGEKTCTLEHESFKIKRLQEEIAGLRRRVERAKKMELANTADEVLLEEIREYKEQLTCPSCQVKRKDAVLTKCFHVFCFDCLKTRYETRQRKCPKCNAAFGTNDFHRLYLS